MQISARRLASLALFLLLNTSVNGVVLAAQLPPDVCEQLKGELVSLQAAGLPAQMEQSPKTAARQLTVEQRSDISRYIKVEQQLLFRCPRPPAPPDPLGGLAVAIDPNEQGEITDGTDIVLPRGMPVPKKAKPAVATVAKAAPKVVAKAMATNADPSAAAAAKPKPSPPKPPAKPKPVDAFIPAKPAPPQ